MLLVLLIALLLGLEARHTDLETAYLNSSMKDGMIYMELPAYFNDGTDRVCLLLNRIYGLNQAARIWYQTLHAGLVQIGFHRCAFNGVLYVKYIDGRIVLVTVYVDDTMVIGKPGNIDAVIEELRQTFVMMDLGRVKHLLSKQIHYEPGVMLCLSQTAYIDRHLVEFGKSTVGTVGSPQIHNEKMLPLEKDKTKVNDPEDSCSRPDIANIVRCLERRAGSYTKEKFSCAKRVLPYLAGTRTHGLVCRSRKLQLYGYSDAEHANCPDTSRSISGHVLKFNQWGFGFKSKKQNTVTDGTCKSELVAASTCIENLL
ncbi:putative transposable element [Phytophthora palmivora]|uniref:Transposable element n=1 Tax=Phytophthora palmivora TaxID=4796 RepID=A0A2P4X0K7_9STRA|nr:putative transposable element [Phytophthora palmivora]